ncbi:MAG: hypothetical protein AAF899_08590 [Pseudomonadota bacterium]
MPLPLLATGGAAVAQGSALGEIPAAPAQGGPRRWEVTAADGVAMRAARSRDARLVARLDRGAILANLGCARAASTVWCSVRPLQGRVPGFVEAAALRAARAPDGTVPIGADDSLDRARRGDFDARGTMRCAQERGEAMGECSLGVARGTGGDATVAVTFGTGFTRLLFFRHGAFTRADTTMSGNGFDTDWRRDGALHLIRVDDQRFELPDAIIFGG